MSEREVIADNGDLFIVRPSDETHERVVFIDKRLCRETSGEGDPRDEADYYVGVPLDAARAVGEALLAVAAEYEAALAEEGDE